MSVSKIVYVEGCDWPNFQLLLEKSGDEACKLADETLALIGAEGRAIAAQKEADAFSFKEEKFKNGEWKVRAKYDPALKGWKSARTDVRLMGFRFEKAAYKRGLGRTKALKMVTDASSYGNFYSNVANLWDRPTKPYSGRSPKVGTTIQGKRKYRVWGKGESRPARLSYGVADIQRGMSQAMPRAEESLEKSLKNLGWK